MALAPVPTPEVLWRQPPVLAMAALPGRTLGRAGQPAVASPGAWAAVGAVLRTLHDAPLPPWPGTSIDELAARLAAAADWFAASEVLPADAVRRHRQLAEAVLRPHEPRFIHGDLHLEHVFVDGDQVTGIIDWSEAAPGHPMSDLAALTLSDEDHLDQLLVGYGHDDVDRDVVLAWRSFRCLVAVPWLAENGYGPPEDYPEVAVLGT